MGTAIEAGGGTWPVLRALVAGVALIGLPACGPLVKMEAPSPGGPRISRLEFVPTGPRADCPIAIRVHLDAADRAIIQVGVGWVRMAGRSRVSGYVVLPARPEPSGNVVASLGPERSGLYSYHVQVEDRAGRWSNVLSRRLTVAAPPTEERARCS
jgi:hypothetical protein